MADLQQSALAYLAKVYGGAWKADLVETVSAANMEDFEISLELSAPLAKAAKSVPAAYTTEAGVGVFAPQIGWQVLQASSGGQYQTMWLDTTNGMIWDPTEGRLYGTSEVKTKAGGGWWLWALVGVGLALALFPSKKKEK